MNRFSKKRYLALGDSMSIDKYTDVSGGGAVSQFYKKLGDDWALEDHTFDGCTIPEVPIDKSGDIITLTIGGNDALIHMEEVAEVGVDFLLDQHLNLLQDIRKKNPDALFIIGNIYRPQEKLHQLLYERLDQFNNGISNNIEKVNGYLADIYTSFHGNEQSYLCYNIEPNLKGAAVIADLFSEIYTTNSNKDR